MSAWNDPWKCLAFHALAARPNLRFQGPEHLLRGVREWLKRAAGDAPETLHVPAGRLGAAPVAEFWIGKYPVTNAQYAFFCMARGLRPPYYLETEDARGQDRLALAGPWCPVTHVCLDHAQQYCEWLGQRTGRRWRLPREREWVRAALLEGAGPYPWGTAEPSSRHANYDRFLTSPTVVGAFPEGRSAAGCYDMAGNVWEWCSDFVSDHESLRVLKGGAYDFSSDCLKVARRQGVVALYRSAHAGFRVVCEEKPDG
jgi:serine/threonine-protein kinase